MHDRPLCYGGYSNIDATQGSKDSQYNMREETTECREGMYALGAKTWKSSGRRCSTGVGEELRQEGDVLELLSCSAVISPHQGN